MTKFNSVKTRIQCYFLVLQKGCTLHMIFLQRLDDLRKAKNNVITKREREVIQVKGPGLGRPPGVEISKHKELVYIDYSFI